MPAPEADVPAAEITTAILDWWGAGRRDLPWRQTRDPWAILVSEVMTQQTQVERAVPKWIEFLDRFPTPHAAAIAGPGSLIAMWSGLGYNRRARNLHRVAVLVDEQHGGALPNDLDALLALPGIGPYTARAVLAFAFEADVAVVDTNVGRIVARLAGRTLARAEVQHIADRMVPPGLGWRWNQAVLDFGALVCTKRAPDCGSCPVARSCRWRGVGADPAIGSAAVSSPQSRFAGSDRQGRGRLVRALTSGPVDVERLAEVMGWPDDPVRARRVADGVCRDGLALLVDGALDLPTSDA